MLAIILLVFLLFATCLAEQKSKILVQSNMDSLHGRLTDRASMLLHVNKSTSALANALKLTEISSFSEIENKVTSLVLKLFTNCFNYFFFELLWWAISSMNYNSNIFVNSLVLLNSQYTIHLNLILLVLTQMVD